tara:strand:- start:4209 stop:5846 length:1638 start_codon:yes stop_codon:yes gene_type:complete
VIILSDIPTYMLGKTLNNQNIFVSETINFPNELDRLDCICQDVLVIIGDVFFREFLQAKDWEKTIDICYQILDIFKLKIDELTKKDNKVFINLIPTHFLVSDKKSHLYLKQDSADLNIKNLNNNLINSFSKNENVFFLEGIKHIDSDYAKDYFRYSSYLNVPLSVQIANQFISLKRKITFKKKKLIICDLDNTLWKGILGDDLKSGIKMDPSDPIGKIFYTVQRILLGLKDKGFLIAICSKNEEKNALDTLFNSTSSVFKSDDIVSHRINWKPKSENIKNICEEIGLSFNEIIFIDDSKYECDEVNRNCKGITVIEVPKDIYQFPCQLKSNIVFEYNKVTEEDKKRTQLYKEKSTRKKLYKNIKKTKSSKDEWIKSLDTKLLINNVNLNSEYFTRIIQLFNRTNQFNLKSNKYDTTSFTNKLKSSKYKYYYGIVSDRIGSEGLISVLGFNEDKNFLYVSDYILSCRVFNRYIEELMLLPILKLAKKKNLGILFELNITERNKISTSFIHKICDKSSLISNHLVSNLINQYSELPVSVEICDNLKY